MAQRPAEHLKSASRELAALLNAGNGDQAQALALMHQLNLPLPPPGARRVFQPGRKPATAGTGKVGLWQRTVAGGKTCYERDVARRQEWPLWADTHLIPPKGSGKRVVLLGESVARGYFYDPHYSVAAALESILQAYMDTRSEVVDLARTNLELDQLGEITVECQALEPDALVVFAGNNWLFDLRRSITDDDYPEMAETIAREGVAGLKKMLEARMEQLVRQYLTDLAGLAAARGIPVVLVLPEFNLLDWRSSTTEHIPTVLPGNGTAAWGAARTRAEKAAAGEDREGLRGHAAEMIRLDPSHPLGYELLADCLHRQGQYQEARALLETARDTALFLRSTCKPRCLDVITRVIRQEANRLNLHLVDLPRLLAVHTGGALPGRELFLDYCHLTAQGITLAMGHAAQGLIKSLTGRTLPAETLASGAVLPDAEVVAFAHFTAAIHNSHAGQPYDILYHHCRRALEASPTVAEAMGQVADFVTRRSVTVLCATHEALITSDHNVQFHNTLLTHPRNRKPMDFALAEAIIEALHAAGIAIREQIEQLRQEEHGVTYEKTDLLRSCYHLNSSYEFAGAAAPRGCFQTRNTASDFTFVAGGRAALTGNITLRSPAGADQPVVLTVNGTPVASLPAGKTWASYPFRIGAECLRDGINTLRLVWPVTGAAGAGAGREPGTVDALLHRLYPTQGEIYHFTLAKAR